MKSFGIWYKKIESKSDDKEVVVQENINDEEGKCVETEMDVEVLEPEAALHVNFWSCEDIMEPKNGRKPFLDIGIKIENYKLIDELCFHCPFPLTKDNILDLSGKLEKKRNACLIFNEDCEVETKDSYIIVKIGEDDKDNDKVEEILLFPLEQVVKNVFEVQTAEGCEDATNIVFKFFDFSEYISRIEALKKLNKIYIRFRIQNVKMMDYLLFDSEPMNKSFESAFTGTRIIDFKINEKRNINEKEMATLVIRKKDWLKITKIHFLVMTPASFDVEALSPYKMSCRELEQTVWDDYLNIKNPDKKKDHMLAYHWRKENDEKDKHAFSCLVKIKYSKARRWTIISYIIIAVILGMAGSLGVSVIDKLVTNGMNSDFWSFLLWNLFVIAIGVIGVKIIGRKKD